MPKLNLKEAVVCNHVMFLFDFVVVHFCWKFKTHGKLWFLFNAMTEVGAYFAS